MQDTLTAAATIVELAFALLFFLPLLHRPIPPQQSIDQHTPNTIAAVVDAAPNLDAQLVKVLLKKIDLDEIAELATIHSAAKRSVPCPTYRVGRISPDIDVTIRELKARASAWNKANPRNKIKDWNRMKRSDLLFALEEVGAV